VVLAARIHPGETNASHVLEGFVSQLLEGSPAAERLLAAAQFHIVPMLNPDGVVAGNYRTSFSGCDLNRSFG
jgi:cytosolic carboxypeptidase protein 2/3